MSAELQEFLALAIVFLVLGVALYLRFRGLKRRGPGCHGCYGSSSSCHSEPAAKALTPIQLSRR